MPDRLGDALANSESARHNLLCVNCGDSVKGSTPIGVRLAMKFHRKRCPGRAEPKEEIPVVNAREIGNQLQSLSTSIVSGVNGFSSHATGALVESQQAIQQCKVAAEESIGYVVQMLGEDHPGAVAIVGNTGRVSEICEDSFNQIQSIIDMLNGMPDAANTLGFVYQNVGEQIATSGQ